MIARRLAVLCLIAVSALFTRAQEAELVAPAAGGDRVAVLVELNEPPAAVAYANALAAAAEAPRGGRRRAVSQTARAAAVRAGREQVTRNLAAQARMRPRLLAATAGAVPMFETQRVLNAIALEVPREGVDALRRVPGVRRIIIIEPEYPTNSTSMPFLGMPDVWSDTIGLGVNADGTGVSIAVIDTGIDYQHGTFGGTGVLADYQANDRTAAPDAYFPTAKVGGGYDFAGDSYNGTAGSIAADPDPMDCNGHGTHVAGTAAGFGVKSDGTTYTGPYNNAAPYQSMRVGPGTAPGATLYALRVFGCGGATNLTVQAIEWAVDPNGDDDLSDHVDVINMSLGSTFGQLASSSAVAADNAAKLGVIVVTSAGNSGDTYYVSGSPGSGDRVLSTAGVQDSGLGGNAIRVNAPAGIAAFYTSFAAAFGTAPPPGGLTADVVLALDPADGAGPLTTDACSPLTNAAAVAGKIAIVDRGTCGFTVKVKNAQDAGAVGVLIGNSAAGAFGTPGGADPSITIPSGMITFADVNTLKSNLAGLNVTMFGAGDLVYTSSSRGSRRFGQITAKPDIAAPGVGITSAQTGVTCTGSSPSTGCQVSNATGFIADSQPLVLSGTSMAAPHVAGIMALLRQLHPDWSVEELKAAAMNGAINDVTTLPEGNGVRFDPGRIGAGRVDPATSALTQVVAFNDEVAGVVSLSFDLQGPTAPVTQTRRLRMVNRSSSPVTYDLGIDTLSDAPGLVFSIPGPGSVTIPAHDSVTIDVQLSATPSEMDHTRAPTVSATQTAPSSPASVATLGALSRHWLTEESGYVTLSQSGTLALRVPVYVASAPASLMAAADTINTGGAPTGSTTIEVNGTDVCTGTPGPVTCSGSFPTDQVSLVTPFELQVISPPSPTVAPGYADLQYAGVAYTAATDQLLFGVSTWEPWGTPTDVAFNIYVDCGVYTNGANFAADTCNGVPDGNWDLVLFNTNPGALSNLFGVSALPQDSFITAVFVRTRSSVVFGPANYVNRLSAGAADTRVFNNQVMFLAADRTRLKISAATGAFQYQVRTCPGSSPLCLALNGFVWDQELGPYSWNYLAANQGLDFGGGNLYFDLDGATLPVTWNTANLSANGSHGALLLHHHNTRGKRAEAVVLDSAATQADVSISIAPSDPTPDLGDDVTFTLTVQNSGPASAANVAGSAYLPAGLVFVSHTGGAAYDETTGLWTIGTLASGGSATFDLVATVGTTDPVTFAAVAGSSTLDLDLSNNEAAVMLQAPRSADLQLSMATSSPTVTAGANVTYTITARNEGEDSAYAVSVAESFPSFASLDPISYTVSAGSYSPATGTWNLAGLPKGQTATLAMTVTTPSMAGALTNNASGTLDTNDPNTANNAASATVTVLSPATISGVMSSFTNRRPGDAVTYTIVLTNSGVATQFDNPGDEFVDVLPASLILISAEANSGTVTMDAGTRTVRWNGSLAPAQSVTITIAAMIDPAALPGTSVTNQGTVFFDGDGNGTNESQVTTDAATFAVAEAVGIPTLSPIALLLMAAAIALVAMKLVRG